MTSHLPHWFVEQAPGPYHFANRRYVQRPYALHESRVAAQQPILSSRPKWRDRARSSGPMLRRLHIRRLFIWLEVRVCAPQTACDPSTSVGMTEMSFSLSCDVAERIGDYLL